MNLLSVEAPAATMASVSDADMYERVISAILDHRLVPGTKLVEDRLASAFGVSRTRVRPLLARLAHERIVTLRPNRGAVVSEPSPEEAREVFEARGLIEPSLLAHFIARASDEDVAALQQLVDAEAAARQQGERYRVIRLTGEFHLAMAERSGQRTLGAMLAELISRTSLILMTYGPTQDAGGHGTQACGCHEHLALIDAIRLRSVPEAQRLMRAHLQGIEASLVWALPEPSPVDIAELLDV